MDKNGWIEWGSISSLIQFMGRFRGMRKMFVPRRKKMFSQTIRWREGGKSRLLKLLLATTMLFFLRCAEMPVFRGEIFYPRIKQPAVTIKLLETKNSLSIRSNGSFVIRCFPRKGERSIYYASAEILVKFSEGRIILSEKNQGEIERNLYKVSFFPQEESFWLYLNGKPYRGAMEIIASENPGSLLALNLIHVEDYLKGVVPAEMGRLTRKEVEALKAQAVAARTYSLSRLGQHAEGKYDLEVSVVDQIYVGVEGEDPLVNQAIELTAGEVLTYEGKLIHAYYHANCGGRTEYIEKVWNKPEESYLISIDDADFCSWSKNYSWEERWSEGALRRNIQNYLGEHKISSNGESGRLLDLQVKKRSPSGRIELLEVVTDKGSYRIPGDEIRWILGRGNEPGSILPSTLFDLIIERKEEGDIQWIVARGRGNGHGVGMCQTGAIGMAREGYSYREILTHYYPGVKISRLY